MICPLDAPEGTDVVIEVLDEPVTTAVVPLNLTTFSLLVVEKPVPVIMTVVFEVPLNGEKLEIDGVTVKSVENVFSLPLTVTLIGPVVAPAGTVVTI